MNMSKHTEGPWEHIEHEDVEQGLIYAKGAHIATVKDCHVTGDEFAANAKLIAVSPDMLEVLRDALALIVNGPEGCDDDPQRITDMIRAIISKATS